MWYMVHMPRPHIDTNGNDLLQQIILSLSLYSKCEYREGKKSRIQTDTLRDSDTFRWFLLHYIIICDMSHAFHIELVIAQALSIVIYYCCCCCCRHHRRHCRYLLLSILILILFYYYYNVNDSRQRIPIETCVYCKHTHSEMHIYWDGERILAFCIWVYCSISINTKERNRSFYAGQMDNSTPNYARYSYHMCALCIANGYRFN